MHKIAVRSDSLRVVGTTLKGRGYSRVGFQGKGILVLYTAVLVACLASSHGDCRTHEMLINGSANPISAFVEAQTRAAEWLAEHPELAQQSLTIRAGRSA
jgi:hypothetical protein